MFYVYVYVLYIDVCIYLYVLWFYVIGGGKLIMRISNENINVVPAPKSINNTKQTLDHIVLFI